MTVLLACNLVNKWMGALTMKHDYDFLYGNKKMIQNVRFLTEIFSSLKLHIFISSQNKSAHVHGSICSVILFQNRFNKIKPQHQMLST